VRLRFFFVIGRKHMNIRDFRVAPGAPEKKTSTELSNPGPAVRRQTETRDPPSFREGGMPMASASRTKIYTHLWYATQAEEAAKLYTSIFPDSRVERVTSLLSESPSGPPGSVKVVEFTLLGQHFQAMSAGPHHDFNDAISIVVSCDDQAELDRYWNGLIESGGKPQACGWLIDRFGLRWQIVPAALEQWMHNEAHPARSKRVTDALLKMVKLDIAALEKAYRG
jgi:predicted 3-demethylubiquinone-9 3-methyltransferase (glyoxalase superfamily)